MSFVKAMSSRSLRYLSLVISSMMMAACLDAGAEEVFVLPNRYIVQRGSSHVGILSADQVRYTIVKPTEYFDVVVPDRSGVQISAASVGRVLAPPTSLCMNALCDACARCFPRAAPRLLFSDPRCTSCCISAAAKA